MLSKGMKMATHTVNITVTTSARNFQEVNEEISKLKILVGALLAKLPPEQRDNFIQDLNGFGFKEEIALYSHFNPKI